MGTQILSWLGIRVIKYRYGLILSLRKTMNEFQCLQFMNPNGCFLIQLHVLPKAIRVEQYTEVLAKRVWNNMVVNKTNRIGP